MTAAAVPVRLTVCGLLVALSVTVKVPVRGFAVAVGVNVTRMVQFAGVPGEGCRVMLLQVVEDTAKSPLIPTAEDPRVTGAAPVAVTVTVCAALVVPMIWLLKVSEVGNAPAV